MSKEKYIRLSGWGLVVGALSFFVGIALSFGETAWYDPLGGADAFYEYGQIITIPLGLLLVAMGIWGLRVRYGQQAGALGNVSLLVSILGGLIGFVIGFPLYFQIDGPWWNVFVTGLLLLFIGMGVFGIAAIKSHPLPKWNILPLVTGLWIPLLFTVSNVSESIGDVLFPMALILSMLGFAALGYLLQSDVPDSIVSTA